MLVQVKEASRTPNRYDQNLWRECSPQHTIMKILSTEKKKEYRKL
jgi:hypothetical protein